MALRQTMRTAISIHSAIHLNHMKARIQPWQGVRNSATKCASVQRLHPSGEHHSRQQFRNEVSQSSEDLTQQHHFTKVRILLPPLDGSIIRNHLDTT